MRILINITSMTPMGLQRTGFPGCFLRSPRKSIKVARQIGYDGAYGTSQRGSHGDEELEAWEGAWNAVPGFWHAAHRKEGAGGMPSRLRDWVVFPGPERCAAVEGRYAKRGIVKVVHHVKDLRGKYVLEVNPEMGISVERLVLYIKMQAALGIFCGLCLDTEHGVRLCHNGQDSPIVTEYRDRKEPEAEAVKPSDVWAWLVEATAEYVTMLHVKDCDGVHAERARWAVRHLPHLENLVAERQPDVKGGDLLPWRSRVRAVEMFEFLRELEKLHSKLYPTV